MLSYRRLFRNGLSFNSFPQSLLLSQFPPGLVALIAVSVLTCATISNDEPPALPPSNSSTPQVANVQLSSCPNSSTLGIPCSCGSGKPTLLAPNLLITNPPPSTSLTFGLKLVHLLMPSRPFQMLTFVHISGLKMTQLRSLHWNTIIRIQQVVMTSSTTSGTTGDRLTPSQL